MEQKKITLLAIFALAILAVFLIFYNSKNKDTQSVDDPSQEEIGENTVVDGDTEGENSGVVDDIKIVDSNKAKLDEALKRGNEQFSKGNYDKAIEIYNEALAIRESDVVYMRLYSAYSAKGEVDKAIEMIDKAIAIFPAFTDYWVTKLTLLDEKTNTSFADLKKIYDEAFSKVDSRTRLNLMLGFTTIAENNKEFAYAITLWEEAKKIYPGNASVYQAEIDRLKDLMN